MTRFLAKITFDCNDGDDVYGLQVITEAEAEMVRRNSHKQISFGSGDWGENAESVGSCIRLQPISDEEYNVLKKLGLDRFGEHFYPDELDSMPVDEDDEDEDLLSEDEDEEDGNAPMPYVDNLESYIGHLAIERTTPIGATYFLKEKDPNNTRTVVHQTSNYSFEKIYIKDRAVFLNYTRSTRELLQPIVDELNSQCETPEFKIV